MRIAPAVHPQLIAHAGSCFDFNGCGGQNPLKSKHERSIRGEAADARKTHPQYLHPLSPHRPSRSAGTTAKASGDP
jgi:hypothetical protein